MGIQKIMVTLKGNKFKVRKGNIEKDHEQTITLFPSGGD